MKNKCLIVFSGFNNTKFVLLTGASIVLLGLIGYFNPLWVSAQIADKVKVEGSFFGPEFVENSGGVDTSFAANLLTDFESGIGVTAVVKQPDGKLLIAGNFTNVGGISRRNLVRLNPDSSVDTSFDSGPGAYSIYALVVQPDGKILVGGSFTNFNNSNRNGLVRLNPDGSLDASFEVSFPYGSSGVNSITLLPNGKILITGNFNSIGDVTFPGIALLNSDGNVDSSFNPGIITNNGSQPNISNAAVQADGKILIIGYFSNINGNVRNRVARLHSNGQLDLSFDTGIGPNNPANIILPTPDGKIFLGGDFTSINGTVRTKIARLNENGGLDNTFNFADQGEISIRTMVLQPDGKIIAAANTTYSPGSNFRSVFRLNTDGSLDSTFASPIGAGNAGFNGYVAGLILESDGRIITIGSFTFVANSPKKAVARLNQNGTLDTSFGILLGSNGTVNIITTQLDGKILISGNFSHVNGIARNRFVRLNMDGAVDATFNPSLTQGLSGSSVFITAMVVQPDGKILIGGNIASVNGASTSGFFRLNADGSTDTSFTITASSTVHSIAMQPDGKIIIGGAFYQINGAERRSLARINNNGSLDTSFNIGTGPNGAVTKLALQNDGKVIITGTFDNYNGVQRRGIARINADGSLDTSFNADMNGNVGSVRGLVIQPDGKVLLGGSFFQINGLNRRYIARLNTDGSFDATLGTIFGQEYGINAVELQPDGKILIAGNFNSVFGAIRRKAARLNQDGSVDTVFNPGSGPDQEVLAMARQSDGKVLIGGNFITVDGIARIGIARLRVNTCVVSPLYDFDGDGKTDLSVYRPDGGSWFRLNTTNNTYYQQLFGLPTDRIVPGDYDGDSKTDIAVFRPTEGIWYILNSRTGFSAIKFGVSEDKPLSADFDGDGKDDLAVFRPSTGSWYILRSTLGFTAINFGSSDDVPVIADFDGDCQADIAVFRPSIGAWYWLQSSDGSFRAVQFGANGDIPVAGDYDGDGKTDLSVFRPSNGTWYFLKSQKGFSALQFGISTDTPVPADYDGDGITDIAVFRNGSWYILQSLDGKIQTARFEEGNDQPVPAAYLSR